MSPRKQRTTSNETNITQPTHEVITHQPIADNETNNYKPMDIYFSYSENFNRVIEFTTENYSSWKSNMIDNK